MAPVAIRGIRKSYGSVAVIHGVDVDIDDGDFVILVGPSGCGKSTLLRMVAGLEAVTQGEIRIGGRKVKAVRAKDRDVAMVFQNYALYPHMTVGENMGFALKLAGKPREDVMRRVSAAADILGLTALLDRLPKQLSGGQRQRVAMGRAIVRDPQVFLFDEPLSNLDAKLRVQMRTEIKALHQRLGTTTIYVTHDQVEAMTMADKIVVMHDGVVEQMGTPLDLYDHPDNLFVASFIGSPAMNMVAGQIRGGRFVTDGNLELPHALDARSLDGRRAVYGIRPEHIELDDEGMEATVVVVEPTGSESLVAITVAGQMLNCVFRERISAKPGDTLRIRFKGDRVHLFDQTTGRRLGAPERNAGIVGLPKESDGDSRVAASIAPAKVRPRFLDTLRSAFKRSDPYRPELHYMRGPSPRSLAARSNTQGEQS